MSGGSVGKGKSYDPNGIAYQVPVGGIPQHELPDKMEAALKELERKFPGLGISFWLYERHTQGGISYISNSRREDVIKMTLEWVDRNLK